MLLRKLGASLFAGVSIGFCVNYVLFNISRKMNHPGLAAGPTINVNMSAYEEEHNHTQGLSLLSQALFKNVKVLCWILTDPALHRSNADRIKTSWASHCNKVLFMSTGDDEQLAAVNLKTLGSDNVGFGYKWNSIKIAYKYVWTHYRDQYDWFLTPDADYFIVMENLRYRLLQHDSRKEVYLGHAAGFPGHILSKSALTWFVKSGCDTREIGDDHSRLPFCLTKHGVTMGNLMETQPNDVILAVPSFLQCRPQLPIGIWLTVAGGCGAHMSCCSDMATSFHYNNPAEVDALEFLVYHWRLFGNRIGDTSLATPKLFAKKELAAVALCRQVINCTIGSPHRFGILER